VLDLQKLYYLGKYTVSPTSLQLTALQYEGQYRFRLSNKNYNSETFKSIFTLNFDQHSDEINIRGNPTARAGPRSHKFSSQSRLGI
jgi:hypothetical protein